MKKTISIIITIITLFTAYSCRQQDDEVNQDQTHENMLSNRSISAKEVDSIRTSSNYDEIGDDTTILEGGDGDPPPKNGGQWKIVN